MAANWSGWYWRLFRVSVLAMGGAIAVLGDCAIAQVTPDGTLGAESSVVTPTSVNGLPGNQIDGGATRGANLFHSFEQFSIPTGSEASFNNALDIQNVISRVTGSSISNIDGLLRANGAANIFLLNPNGIVFGPNATLNIGGSFMATTANTIGFGNQGFFSASASDVPPLLTVNPDAFLFNQVGAGEITINSRRDRRDIGFDPDYRLYGQKLAQVEGLKVPDGQSLLLLGGNIRLDGGTLQARGGRVELGGVSGMGTVGLNDDGSMSFPNSLVRADISLNNGAEVNVLAGGGGSIAINAQNLNLAGPQKSSLQAGIYTGSGSIGSFAGNIEINATGTISLYDGSFIANTVLARAVGNSGDININTESLFLTDGTNLSTSTVGQGNAGSVNINARDTVSFDSSVAFSSVENIKTDNGFSFNGVAVGNGGDINITTRLLSVTNAARLQAYTLGQGNAGSVNINARDTVSFDGVRNDFEDQDPETEGYYSSAALSGVFEGAVGNGGDINITARSLSLTNGGELLANTSGQGNAGSININTRDSVSFDGVGGSNGYPGAALSSVEEDGLGNGGDINITTGSLSVSNGAQLSARTNGLGNAGSININARDSVSFDGVGGNNRYFSVALSSVEEDGVGNGGEINITTGSLSLMNGGGLIASSEGSGTAGNIAIAARSIRLEDEALIDANTIAGQGNIELRSGDLVLRRSSNITTNATGSASGGNITIDTGVLAALEESDISANSANSLGGRVTINSQGIFGTEFREQPTSESDITATGGSPELSGTVEINRLDIDPTQGLVNLPVEVVDASNQIAQGCPADGENKFIITGRGGLPSNPNDPLTGDNVLTEWNTLDSDTENRSGAEEGGATRKSGVRKGSVKGTKKSRMPGQDVWADTQATRSSYHELQ